MLGQDLAADGDLPGRRVGHLLLVERFLSASAFQIEHHHGLVPLQREFLVDVIRVLGAVVGVNLDVDLSCRQLPQTRRTSSR